MITDPYYFPESETWRHINILGDIKYTRDRSGDIIHNTIGPALIIHDALNGWLINFYYINGVQYSKADWQQIISYQEADQSAAINILTALE